MSGSAISQRLRSKIETAIETLMALLDEADGDSDLEPQCDDDCCLAADDDLSPCPARLPLYHGRMPGQLEDDERCGDWIAGGTFEAA